MAYKTWETIKEAYCNRAAMEVTLDIEVVYPSEVLPDQGPRIVAHRCSHALDCNQFSQAACVWAGTNPLFDPLMEKQ